METGIVKQKPDFEPCVLEIKFDTKEEWDTFQWMMSCNFTVPNAIYNSGNCKVGNKQKLEDMMTVIHNTMRKEVLDDFR